MECGTSVAQTLVWQYVSNFLVPDSFPALNFAPFLMNRENYYPRPVIPFWNTTFLLLLSIPILSAVFTEKKKVDVGENPAVMVCNDPKPITRWNQLTPAERDSLNDADPLTNVKNFDTGLDDAFASPILVDINVTGAPNAVDNATINNQAPERWGFKAFNNARSAAGESGTQYCFSFSSPAPFEVNSSEHRFFHEGEHVRVTAKLAGVDVNISGGLHGPVTTATVAGDGTTEIHFDAHQQYGVGVWWDANSAGNDVDLVCVEYYKEAPGQSDLGGEPFSIALCNTTRALFDDPFALTDPANNPPVGNIPDNLSFTKEITCVEQGADAGNVEVTFQLQLTNNGVDNLTNIQLVDDLADHIPAAAYLGVVGASFGVGNLLVADPVLNPGFDGATDLNLLDGASGEIAPGQTLVLDLTILMDPNQLGEYDPITNQVLAFATDPLDGLASAASDAPTGAPGDTGGDVDGLLLYIPAVNASLKVLGYNPNPSYDANGNIETTLSLNIKNTGNTQLDELAVTANLAADLGAVFQNLVGTPTVTGTTFSPYPIVDPTFTGSGSNTGLFAVSNIPLSQNDEMTVLVKALLNPDDPTAVSPLTHQLSLSARGLFPDLSPLPICLSTDLSDAGNVAESNNIGYLNDSGGQNDSTQINLPAIRVSQHVAGVDYSTSGLHGNFDVILEVLTQNTGNVGLSGLKLMENLTMPTQLGAAFVAVTGAPQIIPTATDGTTATATNAINPNPAYNGTNDLLAGGGPLLPGELFIVRYRIEVNPDAPGAPGNLKQQVTGFGTGDGILGLAVEVNDASDVGLSPETNNPGILGDTGGSNDPTPLSNCWDQISGGLSCNNSVQVSLNETCVANLIPDMVIEGEIAACSNDGQLPLGIYYEVNSVTTLAGLAVPDMNPATVNVYEIDGSYVGQTLTVKIMDVVYRNSCWGYIHLEDKLGPQFACPTAPVQAQCDDDLAALPLPVLTDNCDPNPVVQFVGEQVIDNNICDDGVYRIRRTYAGHDVNGNPATSQCIVEIEMTRPGVVFPEDISWHCEQYDAYPSIADPTWLDSSITDTDTTDSDIDVDGALGVAILQTTGSGTVANTGGTCGYNVTNSNSILSTCGNSFKIVRTWTVIDWCNGDIILVDGNGNDNVQMIKIEDTIAPVISKTPFEVNANVTGQYPFPCVSTGFLPPPESVTDNCNNDVTIQIITPIGAADYVVPDGSQGGFIPNPGLAIGTYNIEYRATDACGNPSSIFVEVQIVDHLTPSAVCDEITDVNLTSDGTATVFAETFDDGSTDNCCLDHFEVRRMDDPCDDGHDDTVFGPSIKFCCDDAGAGPQMVVFRVFDCHGNFNDCMVQAIVSDKTGPVLTSCPQAQTISCDDFALDYETQLAALNGNQVAQNELFDAAFGTPSFYDNCGFSISKNINVSLTQCLEGTITRTWTATGQEGLLSQSCSQQINVFHQSDWVVQFPADLSATCGNAVPDFGEPDIFNETCEMIAISHLDDTLNVVPDACFKIRRTWTIINWCVVGSDVDQEVIEMPESGLGLPFPACDLDGDGDCDDLTFRDSWNAASMPNNSMANQATGPDTDPDSDPWDGYIVHTQIIKVEDLQDPVFTAGCNLQNVCINDSTCATTVMLPDLGNTIDDCSNNTSVNVSFTDLPNGAGLGPYTNVPPGQYTVTFTATDNCNNQTPCTSTIVVEDCKAPTVFCKDGFIAVIMQTQPPMITVNAAQLDDGSFDNCSNVQFSFTPDTLDIDSTFFCFDMPGDSVEIWVTDAAGNQDFCTTFIQIQGDSACMDDSLVVHIGGFIDTEDGQPVQDVNINLSGQQSSIWATDPTGGFMFPDLPVGNDVTLTPEKNDDHRNGVTTYDLVKISQHILGIQSLDSPYKMIGADANRSGAITTFDLVEIRKLILYITDEFPSNTSWRFVPNDYVFQNPHNPWETPFPEVINFNNVPSNVLDADFIAIKTGDVNGSAQANIYGGTEDRTTHGSMMLLAKNESFKAGDEVLLDMKAKDFAEIGFQFTLQFDPQVLEFEGVSPCLTDAGHLGQRYLDAGILTVSWNDYNSVWVESQSLLQLRFVAKKAGQFREAVQMNSRYTKAEAYNLAGEPLDIDLAFIENPDSGFELLQNVPNPFNESTTIGFRLSRSASATLFISDISGKTVATYEGQFQEGYNEVVVKRSELPSAGIYYYRLDTPDHTATKMMILVN